MHNFWLAAALTLVACGGEAGGEAVETPDAQAAKETVCTAMSPMEGCGGDVYACPRYRRPACESGHASVLGQVTDNAADGLVVCCLM